MIPHRKWREAKPSHLTLSLKLLLSFPSSPAVHFMAGPGCMVCRENILVYLGPLFCADVTRGRHLKSREGRDCRTARGARERGEGAFSQPKPLMPHVNAFSPKCAQIPTFASPTHTLSAHFHLVFLIFNSQFSCKCSKTKELKKQQENQLTDNFVL